MARSRVECAVVCPDGRVVRLVDDDGLPAAEWVLLDPDDPHRSRTVTLTEAVALAGPSGRDVVWAAVCLRLVAGDAAPAVDGLDGHLTGDVQRFWAAPRLR